MIGRAAQFWYLVRELNVAEVERELARRLAVCLVAADEALADRIELLLFAGGLQMVERRPLQGASVGALPDLVVIVAAAEREPSAQEAAAVRALDAWGAPTVLAVAAEHPPSEFETQRWAGLADVPSEHVVGLDLRHEPRARDCLAEAIIGAVPALRLALARHYPAFRPVVAERLVREASGTNAQFALVSSIPAYLPLLGGLVGNVADIVVLTKNQALLLFKLAGIHGRDLSARTNLLAEILPVVGGAFVWRSVARSLIGFLPPLVCAVPKTMVAFVGTYLVGEMARYYYVYGHRPPPAAVDRFRASGLRLFRSASARLQPPRGDLDHP